MTTTDSLGRTTIYTISSGGLAVRLPTSGTDNVTVSHNSSGQVSTVTADGLTWNYAFSLSGTTRTGTVTNPDSSTRSVVSDTGTGLPTSVTDELGRTTTYSYYGNGLLHTATAPEGNQVQYSYDARGNLTTTTYIPKSGSGLSNIVTTAGYDSSCSNPKTCNQPNWTKDAKGNQTDFTYDSTHGGVLTVTRPAATGGANRPQTRLSYTAQQAWYKNSGGSIVASGVSTYLPTGISACSAGSSCTGGATETTATIGYQTGSSGSASNLLRVTQTVAAGDTSVSATVALGYDVIGNVTSIDGPLSGSDDIVIRRYDADRELVGSISPDPDGAGSLKRRAVRTTYNADGVVTKSEIGTVNGTSDSDWAAFNSVRQVTMIPDVSGRPLRVTVTGASSAIYALTEYSYDNMGRVDCVAQRTATAPTGLPCTLATPGPGGNDHITRTTYNAAGQVTKVQTGYGVTGVQADEVTTTHTGNGRVASVTDAEGNKTSYTYDGHDRLLTTYYPNGTKGSGVSSSTDYEWLQYDANSNVTARLLRGYSSDSTKYIAYAYDNLNRLTYKDLPGSEPDVAYSYDLLGRLTQVIDSGSNYVGYAYDALGRVTAQSSPLGVIGVGYDAAGRRTLLVWPDNFYVNYDYQVTGELTKIRENGATTGIGVLATYGYDDLGRRTSLTRGNGTVASYSYDEASQLSSLGDNLTGSTYDFTHGFSYSRLGQILSATRSNDAFAWGGHNLNHSYTSNGLNQITTWAGTSLGYDARGNLNAWGSDAYTYSSENLMTGAPGSVALSYDPLLRLYQTAAGTTTRYQYDGAALIGEYNGSNVLQKRYVFGPGVDEPLVEYAGSGTGSGVRTFLHADERGSVIARSNESGTTVAINSYDEYGYPANHVDGSGHRVSDNVGRFQYTGQAYLPEIGMYNYKARIYSPTLGRFMQTDPIGYGDGLNWYAYTKNDPINFADPTGLDEAEPPEIVVTGHRLSVEFLLSLINQDKSQGFAGAGGLTGNPGAGDGGNGGDEIVVSAEPCTANVKIGNNLEAASDTIGDVSAILTGLGLIGAAVSGMAEQPEGVAGGFVVAKIGGWFGYGASGAQIVGGVFQYFGGSKEIGAGNVKSGIMSILVGAGVAKLISGPAARNAVQRAVDKYLKNATNTAGAIAGLLQYLQSLHPRQAPC